jgi:uroporphyrinogen decarboxylase
MSNYNNDLILRAARGEKTERTPVWLMRQAGRILPEYREVRAAAGSFINLVKNPEMICEVTIQPVDILKVDAAIIFSDILVIPEAMGLPYQMVEAKGPYFENTINNESDLKKIRVAKYEDYHYMPESIEVTVKKLENRVPLIGFAGAPFTIFCYMTEGNGSKTFSKAKKILYTNNKLSHQLLDMITESTIHYLISQVKAGAAMLQIFDSWAGILSPTDYKEFSLKYISTICDEVKRVYPQIPITVFAKGAFFARNEMKDLNTETQDYMRIILGFNPESEGRQLIANVTLDFIRQDATRQCTAIGERGSLRWNALSGTIEHFPAGAASWETVFQKHAERDGSYIAEWRHLIDSISRNELPLVSGEDGLKVLKIIDAARRADLDHKGAIVN